MSDDPTLEEQLIKLRTQFIDNLKIEKERYKKLERQLKNKLELGLFTEMKEYWEKEMNGLEQKLTVLGKTVRNTDVYSRKMIEQHADHIKDNQEKIKELSQRWDDRFIDIETIIGLDHQSEVANIIPFKGRINRVEAVLNKHLVGDPLWRQLNTPERRELSKEEAIEHVRETAKQCREEKEYDSIEDIPIDSKIIIAREKEPPLEDIKIHLENPFGKQLIKEYDRLKEQKLIEETLKDWERFSNWVYNQRKEILLAESIIEEINKYKKELKGRLTK